MFLYEWSNCSLFELDGKMPSENDRFASLLINSEKTTGQAFKSEDGI